MSEPIEIIVKRKAWDAWEAYVKDAPLIREIAPTAVEAVEKVRKRMEQESRG